MYDFDISESRVDESAQRVADKAVEESQARGHAQVTNEHIFVAFAQVEWDMFSRIIHDLGLNPHEIVQEFEERLKLLPNLASKNRLEVSQATKLTFKLALHQATRASRAAISPADLFSAIFEDGYGEAVRIFGRHNIKAQTVIERIAAFYREKELEEGHFKKKFELPPFLKHYATNLNLLVRRDKIPPVYGRDREIRQIIEILCHRERPNSVMLLGEPGVGKTAVVEGLAQRIELNPDSIPIRLRGCQIVSLQMNSMVAGTMLRGMFEERIANVIREIKEKSDLILFVDEAHTMIGAGSALGAPADAAQIFKSSLARGEIRMICATTSNEYNQTLQEDEALARRFRVVNVPEPTIDETRSILNKVRSRLEKNYCVRILDEAIDTALEMSARYQRHLRLPDKVIGWLDTAAVRCEIGRRREVVAKDVIDVISGAAQIPSDMVSRDTSGRFDNMEECLSRRVIGQIKAIKAVTNRLVVNKGPLKENFYRPDGVLLFLGPTGVGKTELAKSLAEFLFGDEHKMIRIDMSEYQDGGVSVDKLIGMPRGIVDSQRGGILTNQLRDNPYSVILLDEIEKASTSVLNMLLTAFDEGWLTDGRGRRAYLSDSIVIMTSNIGSEHLHKLTNPLGFRPASTNMAEIMSQIMGGINRELARKFSPELRNRIDEVVVFTPLTEDETRRIAEKHIGQIKSLLESRKKILDISDDAMDKIIHDGYSLAYGARFLKREIDSKIRVPVSRMLGTCSHFHVVVRDGEVIVEANGEIGLSKTDDLLALS